jgi:hypothetical protein
MGINALFITLGFNSLPYIARGFNPGTPGKQIISIQWRCKINPIYHTMSGGSAMEGSFAGVSHLFVIRYYLNRARPLVFVSMYLRDKLKKALSNQGAAHLDICSESENVV